MDLSDPWENAAIIVFDFVDPCSSSTLTEAPVPVALNLKVFLQGPYNSGSMSTALNSGGFLKASALTQPYNSTSWNYSGSESVSTDPNFFVNHPTIVDWVLIKLRTSTDAASTQSTRAAFIRSDGSIVDLDGISLVKFDGLSPNSYYIVVIHRNHLAVMSHDPVSLPNSSAYDFTTAQTQANGTNSMKDLGSGVYGMWTGDADGNGQIQNSDKNSYWQVQVGLAGYQSADFDLNGQVQNNDKNSYWSVNVGLGTQVP